VNCQSIFFDHDPRPNTSHEIVLANEFTSGLNQSFDYLESAPPNWYRHSARPELAPRKIDLPLTVFVD
jgi:hypothetical protein